MKSKEEYYEWLVKHPAGRKQALMRKDYQASVLNQYGLTENELDTLIEKAEKESQTRLQDNEDKKSKLTFARRDKLHQLNEFWNKIQSKNLGETKA